MQKVWSATLKYRNKEMYTDEGVAKVSEQAVIRKHWLNWKGTNIHWTIGLKLLPYVPPSTEQNVGPSTSALFAPYEQTPEVNQ